MNVAKSQRIRIALVGPYPPPYGGVSVGLQRLKGRLEKRGIDSTVYRLGSGSVPSGDGVINVRNAKKWFLRYFFTTKEDVIHYHNPSLATYVMLSLLALRRKKTVVSVGGQANLENCLNSKGWLERRLARFALRHSSFIVAKGINIAKMCLACGVSPKRVEVIPGFIPPTINNEETKQISQDVWSFIDAHTPVICANAFRISFYAGQDLYGIDMCIDLCAELISSYPQIGFVFCLPDVGDYDYLGKMKERVRRRNVNENFLFVTEPGHFYPILEKSDVFVRPTNTDGDANSLREALYFGIPSVASDVVVRPEGTVLFRSRDLADFTSKVRTVLDNYEQYKKRIQAIKVSDNAVRVLNIYETLANST